MGNANYIGRVGALAVALGIGTAVATTPWVAVAEPSADTSSESSSTSESSSSESSSGPQSASAADSDPVSPVGTSDETDSDTTEIADPIDEEADEDTSEADADLEDAEPATDSESDSESDTEGADVPSSVDEPSDNDGPAQAPKLSIDAPQAARSASAGPSENDPASLEQTPTAETRIDSAAHASADFSTVQQVLVETQPISEPVAIQAAATPVTALVSGVLAWVGLGPSLAHGPVAPVQSTMLWTVLAWARREIYGTSLNQTSTTTDNPVEISQTVSDASAPWGPFEGALRQIRHTFFNRTPTTAYDPAKNTYGDDGVITGDLVAVDPDGDPLTFTVTRPPERGDLVVNPDGTFTYMPGDEFGRIGIDTFTINVDDGAAYRLRGPAGLLVDTLHRGAQLIGLADSDAVDSHPTVEVNPVIGTIAVGDGPTYLAVSPDGTTIYVANSYGNSVSVIDADTNTITDTITFGNSSVSGIAVSPDGTRVYANIDNANTVAVIDTASNTVTTTIAVGDLPAHIVITPDGARAYVTNWFSDTVSVIDTASDTVAATISVGNAPSWVAVSPDGARVYVANHDGDSVSVIDAASSSVIATIAVGNGPEGVAVSPDGARVYVANLGNGSVSVIDTASNATIATIPVGGGPAGVAVSPGGGRIYVANVGDDTVSVIDAASNTVISTIGVGDAPIGVAFDPDGTRVYVANWFDDTVTVINAPTTSLSVLPLQAVSANTGAPAVQARAMAAESAHAGIGGLIRHTFFNRTPTVSYDPAQNTRTDDGVITGDLVAVDPDGDPLTFTVTQAPRYGVVVVNRDGTFTYTPTPDAERIGTDTFTIKVDDGAAYRLRGPAGLLQSALHRFAQVVGLAAPGDIDSSPTVKVTPEVFIDVGSQPADVAVSPDGATAYVVNQVDQTVSVVDTATNTVTHTVAVGENPVAVAVSPNGSRVFVTNRFDDTVSVIDTATNSVVGTIAVGFLPSGLALSPGGTILYVANSQDQTVMKINTSTQTVLATISVSGFPEGVAVSPDGTRVYVTCEGVGGQQAVGTLAVIETTNNTVIGTIDVGEFSPSGVAVSPDGSRVYVANGSNASTVRVIDTASMSVIATVTVGAGPNGVAVSPDGSRVYVTNFTDDTVSVIGTASNTVIATYTVGNSPRGVAVSSDGDRIYVANSGDSTLFVRG